MDQKMSQAEYQLSSEQSTAQSGQLSQFQMPAATNLDTPCSYEQSRRQVSSTVVAEEFLGFLPEKHKVTYVEVPVVEEVVKLVPKYSVVEVEKFVPKYEYEQVEEIVEVPTVQYIDRPVEKIIVHEPGTKLIQECTREEIRHVPKVEIREKEKIVEIPGEEIEIPVIKREANMAGETGNIDQEVPVVIAQTIRPVLTETFDHNEKVDIYQYNPKVKHVDILIPKPVQSQLILVGAVAEEHRPTTIPAPHYNTILKQMNQHLSEDDIAYLPYKIDPDYGIVTFLHPSHIPGIVHYPELDLAAIEQSAAVQQLEQQQQQQQERAAYDGTSGPVDNKVYSYQDQYYNGEHGDMGAAFQSKQAEMRSSSAYDGQASGDFAAETGSPHYDFQDNSMDQVVNYAQAVKKAGEKGGFARKLKCGC